LLITQHDAVSSLGRLFRDQNGKSFGEIAFSRCAATAIDTSWYRGHDPDKLYRVLFIRDFLITEIFRNFRRDIPSIALMAFMRKFPNNFPIPLRISLRSRSLIVIIVNNLDFTRRKCSRCAPSMPRLKKDIELTKNFLQRDKKYPVRPRSHPRYFEKVINTAASPVSHKGLVAR